MLQTVYMQRILKRWRLNGSKIGMSTTGNGMDLQIMLSNHFNNLGGADGVPVYSESNHHMTGGYHQMYHVTDLWEAWIDLMEAVRQRKRGGINKLGSLLHVM